jgi:hypothetical protein
MDSPNTNETYNANFNKIDFIYNYTADLKNIIDETKSAIKKYENELMNVLNKSGEWGLAENKNRLDFGLKGQIKKQLETSGQLPEMTYEQQHAFEQPYAKTYNPSGGKMSRRKQRTHKRKANKKNRKKMR